VIFKGRYHQSSWYTDIPEDWVLAVSDNGWTTNAHGIEWLKHFNSYTKARCVGPWRLLILDGHESHHSVEFLDLCKKNYIIALCMPAHASHILQPLDVGCFSPLKRAYGTEISWMIRHRINHIDKLSFLPAFKAAFKKAITKDTICGGFRGAGLVPFDPDEVLSKLDVRLRNQSATPEQIAAAAIWQAKTPGKPQEFEAQTALLNSRIKSHQNSSPSAILEIARQLSKGATKMAYAAVLQRDRAAALERACEAATERKQRKRKRIQDGGALTGAQGTQKATDTAGNSKRLQKELPADGSASGVRRCSRCKQAGHNSRTCKY
jgi:hypothetical protein